MPLRKLLFRDREPHWCFQQQKSFDSPWEVTSPVQLVAEFNPQLASVVCTDASSYGIGAVLLQIQPSGGKWLIRDVR